MPSTWVFWIHASNAARIEQGYREIAAQVKIPGRGDPKADIFRLVDKWLRDEKNGKWALVLDNADEATVLFETLLTGQKAQVSGSSSGPTQSLLAYLPQSRNGSILVTTRTKSVALQLVEESDIIPIEPMNHTHALTLLEKKLGEQIDREDTSELAVALEFMPLAIVQAAAYIRLRVPRYSVRQYVDEFHKNDKRKASLLNQEGGHLRRDLEAKNSIIITWQISFDHIHQIRPSAANLLSLMSFFDRQGIPEALLKTQNEAGNENTGENAGDDEDDDQEDDSEEDTVSDSSVDEFEADILVLRNYSFITISMNETTFEMHGLVQLAIRKWLEASNQLERWKQQFIKNLSTVFPTGDYENWTKCQALFPHAKSAVAQQPAVDSSLQDWALILYHAAWYACAKGSYAEAATMALKATRTRQKVLGLENEKTLDSMAMLAIAYSGGGRRKEAEELQMQVMETSARVLGMEHPDTLTSISNLVSTYRIQGRWTEAEELEVQVIKTSARVLGTEHPSTLRSMSNLASTYSNQGRWTEAEELGVQVMKTRKRVLGTEHPNTLLSMSNLASTYSNQGRWTEAEELGVQVMETSARVLGTEHPSTLTSMSNLASTYGIQGRWTEAEELGVQVVETRKRVLGTEHPSTLTSMKNLLSTYSNQGRWTEAEELVQVMETSARVLGTEHPDTLTSMSNLASTYSNQGRWTEAEELEVQVVETSARVLGTEHPSTLTSMSNLASTYGIQGRWTEAEELEVQVMETSARVLGTEHPSTLTSMSNLAFTWKSQGRNDEALSLLKECFLLRKHKLGPQHPKTESSLEALNEWQKESLTVES